MMPQIQKGAGITGALRYVLGQGNDPLTGQRLGLQPGEDSRAEVLGGQHFGFAIRTLDDVELARKMMEWAAHPDNQASKTQKCKLDCLHLSLSWHPSYEPSREEMIEAAQSALKVLGMEGARAIFIAHNDTKHRHLHIIASRIDPATGLTYPDHMDQTKLHAWALKWERDKGQVVDARRDLHAIVQAILDRDVDRLIDGLTKRESVFTRNSLERMMIYAGLTGTEREAFRAQVLAHMRIIPLRKTAASAVTHFTTREILAAERAVQRAARELAQNLSHGLSDAWANAMAAKYRLDAEQTAALKHAGGLPGFTMINGQAGTGKSRVLAALREGYERQENTVVGMAWTNQVVADMRNKDGYQIAATITAELYYQRSWPCARGGADALTEQQRKAADKDYTRYVAWIEQRRPLTREMDFSSFVADRQAKARRWDERTVLVIDEASMLSTETMAGVLEKARDARAKVVLTGDPHQLGSIERGGMFEPLQNEHGAATLSDVKRVADPDQKRAFNAMHDRDFGAALKVFDDQHAIQWAANAAQSARNLAQRYMADHAADPSKSRFAFAYTNDQAAVINRQVRAFRHQRHELGPDQTLETAHGRQDFAVGDRIQFTANGAGQAAKKQGFINGAAGVIGAIEMKDGKSVLTVMLDHAAGKKAKEISFTVGANRDAGEFNSIKHGYAGTIYRGQGRTLDQTYLLHSKHWRESSGYVALTRHREQTVIFASRDVAENAAVIADQLKRPERKRAAGAFHVDDSTLRRALDQPPRAAQTFAYDPQLGSRLVDPRTPGATPAATDAQRDTSSATRRDLAARPAPTYDASRAHPAGRTPKQTSTIAAATDRGRRRGQATAAQLATNARKAGRMIGAGLTGGMARGAVNAVGKAVESVASGLANLFEGLLSPPSPETRAERKAEQKAIEEAAPTRQEMRKAASLEQVRVDQAELAKARQEFLRRHGRDDVQQHELGREPDHDRTRNRDRSR